MKRLHEDGLDSVSFRHLRLFEAVGDLRSVRRAAEACGLSQPAVTQALGKLEEQARIRLVERRASGSYLSPCGAILHSRVRRFSEQFEQAIVEAGAAATARAARAISNRLTRAQVRAFLSIIEQGTFEQAARALKISASSLQRAVRDLESNLGVPLFYRTAAGVLVAPTGILFGRKMRLALQEIDFGVEEMQAIRGDSNSQIVIGAMPFGGSVLLATVLDDFLAIHPQANIRIINDSASEMKNSLLGGDVDLVIGLLPDQIEPELVGHALAPTPYSVVVRRGHPLFAKGEVTVADLTAQDWVVGTRGSNRRACFDRLFENRGKPNAQIATCALTVLQHLLRNSDRVTLLTSYELEHGDDTLRALPFGPIKPIPSIGLMMRAEWLPTKLHSDLIEIVRARVATARPALRVVS